MYTAAEAFEGRDTSFRVVQLPNDRVCRESLSVLCDGALYANWSWLDDQSIQIATTITAQSFVVATGYVGGTGVGAEQRRSKM